MFVYGIAVLLVGISLITGMIAIIVGQHRRTGTPYALLTVGILTFIPALIIQVALVQLVDRGLLSILPINALVLGILAGFTQEPARLLGYQFLAPGAVTRPHALMIGTGHSLPAVGYTAIVALGLGFSLLGYGTERPDNPAALASGAMAEALNGLLPVIMHMALSWIVLQVFLRGELYWLFIAVFAHSVTITMALLLGPNDSWAVVLWRLIVAVISLGAITRVRPPAPPQPSAADES